jgi:hypothetical protein
VHTVGVRSANLTVKFLLELVAFASFAAWGWHTGSGIYGVFLAVLVPGLTITVWGLCCAPRSARRFSTRRRVPLELSIFVLAAIALGATGRPTLAVIFAAVFVLNAALLTAYGQWES